MHARAFLAAAVLASLRPALAAQVAERVRDPESGHTYLRTNEALTIYDAEAAARAIGGTLVAIGSRAEETFLLENFGASDVYWIGLEFPRERWATGEALAFTHWVPGEPDGGASQPFTLMNWGEPGAWFDSSGEAETQRFHALIELASGVAPPSGPVAAPAKPSARGVLLCAIQGLSAKDLENARNANLNALWKRSTWTLDACADASGDPLAGLGMLVWGTGSDKSRLASANPANAARNANENLLSRLERVRPEVATVALFDDAALTGVLLDGRADVRISNASPRKGGTHAALAEALARAAPLCVVAAWTDLRVPGAEEPSDVAHSKDIAAIDAELGDVLERLRARPDFAREEWWIAVAGLAPAPNRKAKEGDLRARTGVPLALVIPGAPPGETLADVSLADLVPSALAHLGVEARTSWQLDGRALVLGAPPVWGANLLVNGGGEDQFGWSAGAWPLLRGWRQLAPFRLARHDSKDPAPPAGGQSYFQGGGGALARMEQTIDLGAYAADLERGAVRFRLTGWLGTRHQAPATIGCTLEFLNEQKRPLERAELGPIGVNERRAALGAEKGVPLEGLIPLEAAGQVPRRARAARVILEASGPSVSQTMADELDLVLERE